MQKLHEINNTLERTFSQLRELFDDPGTLSFHDIHTEMERLEELTHAKAYVDAAFAHICERDEAGKTVGARYASNYLTEKLGLSRAEAYNRLSRGKKLFAPEPEPEPSEPSKGEQEAQSKKKRKAREDSAKVSAEKQRIIDLELAHLLPGTTPDKHTLLTQALEAAKTRSPEDLRRWVRKRVENANRTAEKPKKPADPFGPYRNRKVRVGLQRSDGSCDFTITAPAGEAALIKALLDRGLNPGSNLPDDRGEDSRTPGQRRFDQLMAMLGHIESCSHAPAAKGACSIVLSLTLDDLADADADTRFATHTGIDVTAADILRMGFGGKDFIVQFDRATGLPLSVGSTRLATLAQRIALLAAQGVCAWNGCTTPFSELEIHHLTPYASGGLTDIDNLIGLCRQHHRSNNDRRDHSHGLNHTARDTETHRVGVAQPDGTIRFNTTFDAENAAGRRLRHRRPRHNAADPPLFPVPG